MNPELHFHQHELEWTSEKIARFWDYECQNEARSDNYFTLQVGDALIRVARANCPLDEPVLDYGAGVGFLTEKLVQQGVRCSACDFSSSSVESLNRRLAGYEAYETCVLLETLPSGMPSETFGTVFLIETLEHLLPEWRQATLREIWRLLKPGGHVMVTVPYAESLDAGKVFCADCGAVFHRMQHVMAYDETLLAATMAEYRFTSVLCQPVNLRMLTNAGIRQSKQWRSRIRRLFARLKLIAPRSVVTPNLVYIGKKIVK